MRYPWLSSFLGDLPIRQISLRLATLLAGLLIATVLGEVGLRVAGPAVPVARLPLTYDQDALSRIASGDAYVAFDENLGWLPTPLVDRIGGDVHYRHSAAGLRSDRDYSSTPDPGLRRIAAYGDSFTYCEEVEIEDCWTSKLEELLPRSEVLNYGVPGYAADQAWLRFQRGGAAARPCAVLIGHMVENVNRMTNRFRPFYYPETGIPLSKPRFTLVNGRPELLPSPARWLDELRDPEWVETNLGPRDSWYFPGTFVASPLDQLAIGNLARSAWYRSPRRAGVDWTPSWAAGVQRPGQEGFDVTVAVLGGFAEEVRSAGATPLVLIFPWKDEIAAQRDRTPKAHAALLSALQGLGIPTLDLTDELGEQARRSSLGNLTVEHYRPLGNTVVARTVARDLPKVAAATCGR
jgi:hypothetical protein